MPTPNGYTLCPFYERELRYALSCEDTVRRFPDIETKLAYKETYCDHEWKECVYAQALLEAYDKQEHGDLHAVDDLKLSVRAKEIAYLSRRLNRADRRVLDREKKIAELRTEVKEKDDRIQKVENRNRSLFKAKGTLSKELADLKEKVYAQLQAISDFYEARLAYMMDSFGGGTLREGDVKAWADGKEFKLVHDGEKDDLTWRVELRNEEKDSEWLHTGEQINNGE